MSKDYIKKLWDLCKEEIILDYNKENNLSYAKHLFDFASTMYGYDWASENLTSIF